MKKLKKHPPTPEDGFSIMPDYTVEYLLDEDFKLTVYYNPELATQFNLGRLLYKIKHYIMLSSRQGEYAQYFPKDIYELHSNPPYKEFTYWENEKVEDINSEKIPNDDEHVPFFIDHEKKEMWEIFDEDDKRFSEFIKKNQTIVKAIIKLGWADEEPFVSPNSSYRIIIGN